MAEAQAAMVSVRRDNTDPRISRGFPAGLQALLTPDALKLKAGRIKAAANLLVFCVTGRRCVCVGVCVCGSHMKRLLGDGMLDDQLNSVKFLPKDSNAETFEFSVLHAAQRHLRDTFDGTDLSNMQFWNLIIEAVVGAWNKEDKQVRAFCCRTGSSQSRSTVVLKRRAHYFNSYYLDVSHGLDHAYIAHFLELVVQKVRMRSS